MGGQVASIGNASARADEVEDLKVALAGSSGQFSYTNEAAGDPSQHTVTLYLDVLWKANGPIQSQPRECMGFLSTPVEPTVQPEGEARQTMKMRSQKPLA